MSRLYDFSNFVKFSLEHGTLMAVRHKQYKVEGLQFHPESIKMKPHGMQILKNFLDL